MVSGQHHAPAALTPGNIPGAHWPGGWGGPTTGLDSYGEERRILPPQRFDSRTVQPVASRDTDRAIPTPAYKISFFKTSVELGLRLSGMWRRVVWYVCTKFSNSLRPQTLSWRRRQHVRTKRRCIFVGTHRFTSQKALILSPPRESL